MSMEIFVKKNIDVFIKKSIEKIFGDRITIISADLFNVPGIIHLKCNYDKLLFTYKDTLQIIYIPPLTPGNSNIQHVVAEIQKTIDYFDLLVSSPNLQQDRDIHILEKIQMKYGMEVRYWEFPYEKDMFVKSVIEFIRDMSTELMLLKEGVDDYLTVYRRCMQEYVLEEHLEGI